MVDWKGFNMSVCEFLHKEIAKLPRFRHGFNLKDIPANGIYFLFENGEEAHNGERIVRIGTHTGQNNLPKRLKEHLYTPNKDRSVFRKHIGRSLLTCRNDPFLAAWEIDLTTRKAREQFEHKVDKSRLDEIEQEVSDYMNLNFSFAVLPVDGKDERLTAESGLLSAIAACAGCRPSSKWLGLHHPKLVIRESGLWNVLGLDKTPIEQADVERLFLKGAL
ncbi:MAG TPA: hypothetical protein PLX33_08265 [Alphaproteobacteria bacterium]|nr:hypothetical protein [Alphaproteobacteria bacterium]